MLQTVRRLGFISRSFIRRSSLHRSLPIFSSRSFTMAPSDQKLTSLRANLAACRVHQVLANDTIKPLSAESPINIDAIIIGTEDAHQSEYVSSHDARREWISNFTGSAGTVVVTKEHALLWTDGRYYLQAGEQLSEAWTLMKSQETGVPTIEKWLSETFEQGGNVVIDPFLTSVNFTRKLFNALEGTKCQLFMLQPSEKNPVDSVWPDQPEQSLAAVTLLERKFAGLPIAEKLDNLRNRMKKETKAEAVILPALDDIAWLFNLRGTDIQFNPVFLSYALVSMDDAILFVNEEKITLSVRAALDEAQVRTLPYGDAVREISEYTRSKLQGKKVAVDPSQCNFAVFSAVDPEQRVETQSLVLKEKTIKNTVELEGMRQAHIRDGAALTKAFAWLESELQNGNETLTEVDVANKQQQLRSQMEHFVSLSFDTISSIGSNGAVIHYKPEENACGTVNTKELYLNDSGAQYLDGTTDVTRTMHFGTPTEYEKECFTHVLKAHIALATTVFPDQTEGVKLDALTRAPLWRAGLDYRHGTGHGVGCFLNVHEKGVLLSSRVNSQGLGITPGMVLSNEPGYYEDEAFGIRIESVMIARKAHHVKSAPGFNTFCSFETITMTPIQTKLVNKSLLTTEEIEWLNQYHKDVRRHLTAYLKDDPQAYDYLIRETQAI